MRERCAKAARLCPFESPSIKEHKATGLRIYGSYWNRDYQTYKFLRDNRKVGANLSPCLTFRTFLRTYSNDIIISSLARLNPIYARNEDLSNAMVIQFLYSSTMSLEIYAVSIIAPRTLIALFESVLILSICAKREEAR